MSLPAPARRAAQACGTILSAAALAVGLSAGAAGAQVPRPAAPPAANPYSPAYQHPYRHGAVPTISQLRKMDSWARQHPTAQAAPANLIFDGGFHGIGVTTGKPKVYLVFFGSQWGSKGTDGHGNLTLSHDPSHEVPYLQRLFKGLGTNGETWSGVMTQYCEGVHVGAMSCPADSLHVAYPAGGNVLRGVWVDESAASPARAGGHQLAVEAVRAAKHFKNTAAASNRDTQYVILSPHGTHPDGFPATGFCAWHDWNGDGTLSHGGGATSHYGPIAFTNMPYTTDAGIRCGVNFISSPLDGVSMIAGHEYAETITDQVPPGGWLSPVGQENGDLCAWNINSPPGAPAADLALATGSFAMQSTWGNDGSGGAGICEFSHPTVLNSGIFNGGFETGSFQGWTTNGASTSIVRSGVKAGRFAARAGKPTPTKGSSSIGQTFNANGALLSFWYNETCPDTVRQSWATVTLTDNTAHTTVRLLAKGCVKHSGWKQVSHAVIIGHSYTLTLTSHDDHDTRSRDGNATLIDAVTNA